MKYIDAEKLKANIKKRINELDHDKYLSVDSKTARIAELHFIDRRIDSLQQKQPEVDFKVKERKWVHDAVDNVFPEDGDFMSEVDFRKIIKDTARHFYELGVNIRK